MAKNLYLSAQDDKRFLEYISRVDDEHIKPMISAKKDIIIKKALNKSMDNPAKIKMGQQLIEQVCHDYNIYMKKCYALKEMKTPENETLFKEARI